MSHLKDNSLALRFDGCFLPSLTEGEVDLEGKLVLGLGTEVVNVLMLLLVTKLGRTVQ